MADLKSTFLSRRLNEYNREVIELMRRTMISKKVGVTGEGERSLAYTALVNGTSGTTKLSFKEYLRFVDMGAGRGHPLGGLRSVRVELASRNGGGNAFRKDNTFKAKKIYSKIVYGKLPALHNQLLYGFTEETIAALKAELQQLQQTTQTT